MKKVKTTICILLCIIICLILMSCGATKENVVGVRQGSYVYDGSDYRQTLTVNQDGSYEKVMIKNGSIHDVESGKWDIESDKLCLREIGESEWTEFTLSGDTLINGEYVRLRKEG